MLQIVVWLPHACTCNHTHAHPNRITHSRQRTQNLARSRIIYMSSDMSPSTLNLKVSAVGLDLGRGLIEIILCGGLSRTVREPWGSAAERLLSTHEALVRQKKKKISITNPLVI